MDIPSYQIHNVLRDYVKQLQKRLERETEATGDRSSPKSISAPKKLRLVRERVTAEIVERIIHLDMEQSRDSGPGSKHPLNAPRDIADREFVYHVRTGSEGKEKRRLTLQRVEDLVRKHAESTEKDPR